jgi:hypothetical protein
MFMYMYSIGCFIYSFCDKLYENNVQYFPHNWVIGFLEVYE